MRQLRLLDDKTLHYLWRIASGADSPIKGRIWYTFWMKNIDQLMRLDFTLLKLEGLLDAKTTLSKLAIEQGMSYADNMERKAHASLTFSHLRRESSSLIERAQVIRKYFEYLKKTYGTENEVSYEDILRIRREFPRITEFLLMNVIVPAEKIEAIKSYVDKYMEAYIERNLDGQERLYLADHYAALILKRINSDAFIKSFGMKRVSVDGKDIDLCNHSLLYLQRNRAIKIRDIKLIGNIVSATIDNLQLSPNKNAREIKKISKLSDATERPAEFEYHAFISHASEDKNSIARPLAEELIGLGLSIWYDEFSLKIGDSLKQKITEGLAKSKYGIVILSPNFFNKKWTKLELNALFARMVNLEGSEPVILPVWHNISKEQITKQDPILADIVSVNTSINSVSEIAIQLKNVMLD